MFFILTLLAVKWRVDDRQEWECVDVYRLREDCRRCKNQSKPSLCCILVSATFYQVSAHHEHSFCRQTSSVTQKPISREFRGRAISVEKLVARNPGLHNTRPSITRTKRVQWLSRWVFQFFYLIQSFPFQQQMDPSIPDDCMINSLIEKHGDVWVCTRYNITSFDLIFLIIFFFNFFSKLFSQGVARLQLMQEPKQI